MSEIELEIDAGRVLFGLSRIGYTTSSALCDIIDNSVRAKAENIFLIIRKEREDLADVRKDNVKEYVIIDDGEGMDEEKLQDAVKLGSSAQEYGNDSLAKFGLGLKSASFSQGDLLQVISSNGENEFKKLTVSLTDVIESKVYRANEEDLSEDDQGLIEEYLDGKSGTIIKISEVRKDNHPSVKNTILEMKSQIGVIYYYFLKEHLKIFLSGESIVAVDPLFTDEADENGNLNEHDWDGKTVTWVEKQTPITLDDEKNINVEVEVTQLPYPPRFKIDYPGEGKDAEIREKYLIGANNYGFYVYRNKRLISWANRLNGIIPYDQDYYAFRGRIMISSDADEFFNIDVKKSVITLSDEAWNTISDFTIDAKSKSKAAWKNASRIVSEIANKEPETISNEIASQFDQIDFLPGDTEISDEELAKRIEQIQSDMTSKIRNIVKLHKEERNEEIPDNYIPNADEIEAAIKGELNANLKKIFRVLSIEDNLLWEPYYDSDLGNCVRINKLHRFARLIYNKNETNQDLQIVFDLMMLQLADAELYAYRTIPNHDYDILKSILSEFRRIVSEYLANLARKKDDILPPFSSDFTL